MIQQQVETIRIARLHKQPTPIFVQSRFDDVILSKNIRREFRRLIATNQDLHRMLFHLIAHAVNIAFGNDLTVIQQHDSV